jgi:hypothetical protein
MSVIVIFMYLEVRAIHYCTLISGIRYLLLLMFVVSYTIVLHYSHQTLGIGY